MNSHNLNNVRHEARGNFDKKLGQYSMKEPPFATKLCVFSLLFTLHYMFRPIIRPSSGAI
jgi:hypothetical protein